jgi:hypothetical protein
MLLVLLLLLLLLLVWLGVSLQCPPERQPQHWLQAAVLLLCMTRLPCLPRASRMRSERQSLSQRVAVLVHASPAEFTWKVTPALAAGNTVVIKVSKETALTALKIGDLAVQVRCIIIMQDLACHDDRRPEFDPIMCWVGMATDPACCANCTAGIADDTNAVPLPCDPGSSWYCLPCQAERQGVLHCCCCCRLVCLQVCSTS